MTGSKGAKGVAATYTGLAGLVLRNECLRLDVGSRRGRDCRFLGGHPVIMTPFSDNGEFWCCDDNLLDIEALSQECSMIIGGPLMPGPNGETSCVATEYPNGAGAGIVLVGGMQPPNFQAETLCCAAPTLPV